MFVANSSIIGISEFVGRTNRNTGIVVFLAEKSPLGRTFIHACLGSVVGEVRRGAVIDALPF